MTVRLATDLDRARWNGYVEHSPHASVYHRWEWGAVFDGTYGTPFLPLVATHEKRVTGVLPLVKLASPMFGTSLVSVPWFGHGGALADDDATWRALLDAAESLRAEHRAKHVELRHAHPVPARGMATRDDKVLMHLALPPREEDLLKAVGPKTRADIRRPEKEGMSAELGGVELVPEFHKVYAAVMRDLGSPCHDQSLFEATARAMPERSFVALVRYQGEPVGAGFLIGMNDTLEIPCAGSLHHLTRLRGNMLLYWTVIREAIRRGYRTFSFGRSSADSGTFNFKKNWGAVPVPLPYHYLLAPGATLPSMSASNPRYHRVIETWQKLPLGLTNALGPRLVRYIA